MDFTINPINLAGVIPQGTLGDITVGNIFANGCPIFREFRDRVWVNVKLSLPNQSFCIQNCSNNFVCRNFRQEGNGEITSVPFAAVGAVAVAVGAAAAAVAVAGPYIAVASAIYETIRTNVAVFGASCAEPHPQVVPYTLSRFPSCPSSLLKKKIYLFFKKNNC